MGYATKEERREWRLRTYAERRAAWFEGKSCEICGSTENLELDHIDPAHKKNRNDHNVWLWGRARREAELAKCRPLCHECHKTRHLAARKKAEHGTHSGYASGCRCQPCKEAVAEYNRRYRENQRRNLVLDEDGRAPFCAANYASYKRGCRCGDCREAYNRRLDQHPSRGRTTV